MTIIFVDKRGLAFDILRALVDYLPSELAAQVEIYHAMQSQLAKDLAASKFKKGSIRILICTEALTMVSYLNIVTNG
jgi:superfamily II DNA/RNA helicase